MQRIRRRVKERPLACETLLFRLLPLVATAVFACGPATAEGALAIGQSPNVAKTGVAFGWVVNYPEGEAAQKALEYCAKFRTGSRALPQCAVVEVFQEACLAISLDSEAGTSGIGWSIGSTRLKVEAEATEKCQVAADQGREKFCKLVASCCDGKRC